MNFKNFVLIEGRLCEKPELKQTKNGKSFCSFTVAYNQPHKLPQPNEKGETWESIPNFFSVSAWGRTAEAACSLEKGDPVSIPGSLRYDSWIDEKNEKKSRTVILADSVRKLAYEASRPMEAELEALEETVSVSGDGMPSNEEIPF